MPIAALDITMTDSRVSYASSIGIMIMLGGTISDHPSGILCTIGTIGALLIYTNCLLSCAFVAYVW